MTAATRKASEREQDEPAAYMIISPGCKVGPTETLFSVAIARARSMANGTAVVPVYFRGDA